MGCDIHIWAERLTSKGYEAVIDTQFTEGTSPFDWRSYAVFGWLADVRNYSGVKPISHPRGIPSDASDDVRDSADYCHSGSWLTVNELLSIDYDEEIEDRRTTVQTAPNAWNGGATCDHGEGVKTTLREFLGSGFMNDLEMLKSCGAERIVFCFDS